MRDLLRSDAVVALPTMFAGQLILTMAAYTLPVAAPAAMPDMGIPTVYVGVFTTAIYLVAMTTGLLTGSLLSRFGAVRTMQWLLLSVIVGVALFDLGYAVAAILGAMVIGFGSGPMNPTGSYILARTTPPRWRPFVFSTKQCATPAGGMLAGIVVPPVLIWLGWEAAVGTVALGAILVILLIQPSRARLDREKPPARPLDTSAIVEPIKLILRQRELRAIAFMGYVYGGCQITLAAYLVVYLTEQLSLSISAAGLLFAVFGGSGIPIRLFWGVIAERILSSRVILILTGLLMAAGFVLTAAFTVEWPIWALTLVVALLGCSANGWVGIFFAEIVRIAPDDMASEASAGGQFFAYGGIMSVPLVFGAIVAATDDYSVGYLVLTAISLLAVGALLSARPARR